QRSRGGNGRHPGGNEEGHGAGRADPHRHGYRGGSEERRREHRRADPGHQEDHAPEVLLQRAEAEVECDHRPVRAISAKISCMKSPSSVIIDAPKITSTNAIAASFGTKVRVCSLTEVAAWTRPITRPTAKLASSTGAATSAVVHSIRSAKERRIGNSSIRRNSPPESPSAAPTRRPERTAEA